MQPFQITPVFAVTAIERSLAYYIDTLGFRERFRWGDPVSYAGVALHNLVLHLNASPTASDRIGHGCAYIFTEAGVLDYYHQVKANGANVDDTPPEPQAYGLTDFTITDPDGNTITVGEEHG